MKNNFESDNKNVVVNVVELHKYFGELEVLKGITFNVHEGNVLSILGASGSGKTTLLRCINLLEQPTSGEIYIDNLKLIGFNLWTDNLEDIAIS